MVRIDDTLVVGLSRLSFDFSAVGTGAVAIVDLKTKKVVGFELEGLTNCSWVSPVAGTPDAVLVSCAGFFRGVQRDTAGIVMLTITNGEAAIKYSWSGKQNKDLPLSVNNLVSLGGTLVGAVAYGKRAIPATNDAPAVNAEPDIFAVVDLKDGSQAQLFLTDSVYAIGSGLFDAKSGLLLVPDASTDGEKKPTAGVRRFQRDDSNAFRELDVVRVASSLNMPVRQIKPL